MVSKPWRDQGSMRLLVSARENNSILVCHLQQIRGLHTRGQSLPYCHSYGKKAPCCKSLPPLYSIVIDHTAIGATSTTSPHQTSNYLILYMTILFFIHPVLFIHFPKWLKALIFIWTIHSLSSCLSM